MKKNNFKIMFTLFCFVSFFALLFNTLEYWNYQKELAKLKNIYQQQKKTEFEKVATDLDTKLTYLYQSLRTMSLIPGVRKIDRYGKNVDPDTKMTLQQLFNNAYLNIKMSEIYLLPPKLDPSRKDPETGKPEEPIMTFDTFRLTDEPKKEEAKPEIEQVEEFEYRLMNKQLDLLSTKFPNTSSFTHLSYPILSGAPVITCDNADFTKKDLESGNDEPRIGIVFTVPSYDLKGNYHGAVSAVLRNRVLKSFLPADISVGFVNLAYDVKLVQNEQTSEWKSSLSYFEKNTNNPNLIFSSTVQLKFPDVNPWSLWIAYPDNNFWSSPEVVSAKNLFFGLVGATWVLAVGIFWLQYRKKSDHYKILEIIHYLTSGASRLTDASYHMNTSSSSLSEASQEQNKASVKVASALTEIASMIDKTSDSAKSLAQKAEQADKSATSGQQAAEEVVQSTQEISETFQTILHKMSENNGRLSEITTFLKNITEKTKMIDDIVFQTKLLSFNASVEAARAGEMGKGFAVVAEEVGNLAQMSGRSAKEITEIIKSGSKQVESIISETTESIELLSNQGKEKIEKGISVTTQCKEALDEIVGDVKLFSTMALDIQKASKEQATGVEEISEAVQEITTISQKNTSVSEEVSDVSEKLNEEANILNEQVVELSSLMKIKKSEQAKVFDKNSSSSYDNDQREKIKDIAS